MSDAPLHLGPELHRAVNRMDFFRLFKSLAGNHDFRHFALGEIVGDEEGLALHSGHSLHNFPDIWLGKNEAGEPVQVDPVVRHLRQSTVPCAIDLVKTPSRLIKWNAAVSAIVIPLHTPVGKRYGLVLCGDTEPAPHQRLALIALDAALVFQRYYEAILAPESCRGLNDRELQIVRWTSEGKTSAEIAIILGLSEHTVNSYIAAVLRKLQVVNRAQMVASALRNGLIR